LGIGVEGWTCEVERLDTNEAAALGSSLTELAAEVVEAFAKDEVGVGQPARQPYSSYCAALHVAGGTENRVDGRTHRCRAGYQPGAGATPRLVASAR